jgi:hypothetical protein
MVGNVVRRALWSLVFLAIVATMSVAPWSTRPDDARRAQRGMAFSHALFFATPGAVDRREGGAVGARQRDQGDGFQFPVQSPSSTASKPCP